MATRRLSIIYLAGVGRIELHSWLASRADFTHPDRVVFDLDPFELSSLDEARNSLSRPGGNSPL
jgi:DNA primase